MGLSGTVKTKVSNGRLFQQPWYYAIGEERVSLHGYCSLMLKINVSLSGHVRKGNHLGPGLAVAEIKMQCPYFAEHYFGHISSSSLLFELPFGIEGLAERSAADVP